MQIHPFVEVTELKNSRSLSFLSLEIEYKTSFITRPVIGARRRINQNVGSSVFESQLLCWLSGIKSALDNFSYLPCFSGLCGQASFPS